MQTKLYKPNSETYKICAKLINENNLVAFPTETVYGLGANAFSDKAIDKIYDVKGRPQNKPLTVHLADKKDISIAAKYITDTAQKIIDSFMPGPVTIILNRNKSISDKVTAGFDTVGIRIPSNNIAALFIKECNVPIAAPSANVSFRPSPTTAEHVFADLGGKIPAIIDGGNCSLGIESTVIDATGDIPVILRQGGISEKEIISVCGSVINKDAGGSYSPSCPCIMVEGEPENIYNIYNKYKKNCKNIVVLCYNENAARLKGIDIINLGQDNRSAAALFYSALREGEKRADIILIERPKKDDLEKTLLSRILNACKTGQNKREDI